MQDFVIENTKPGVTVLLNTAQVARPVQRQPTSTFFIVGYSPWGPVNQPTIVTSWADYTRQFGPFDDNSFMDDAAYTFFNVFPGKTAVINRVVGAAAAVATLTLKDRSADAGLNTARIDAAYPSSRVDIRVTVENGTKADTFRLIARSTLLNRREIFDNLKMDAASVDYVNQTSRLIRITDLGSATAAPNDIPRVLAETLLAGGTDDFAGLSAADFIGTDDGETKTGLQAFKDRNLGAGQVAIPGMTSDAVHAALVAHGDAYERMALLDPPLASDKATVAAIRALYGTWFGAIYWPWPQMLDYAGSGFRKYYPPSAFAAGACALVDAKIGTHKAPANIVIPGALDVERNAASQSQVDDNTREFLNGRDVNVIAPFANEGVKIYGGRVMTADRRVQMVHEARLLALFSYSLNEAYKWAPFAVVDGSGRLFRDLEQTGRDFLRPFWKAGALFGKKESEAFLVDAHSTSQEELDLGGVRVKAGVKLSQTAERITVQLDNVRLTQDLSVLQQ